MRVTKVDQKRSVPLSVAYDMPQGQLLLGSVLFVIMSMTLGTMSLQFFELEAVSKQFSHRKWPSNTRLYGTNHHKKYQVTWGDRRYTMERYPGTWKRSFFILEKKNERHLSYDAHIDRVWSTTVGKTLAAFRRKCLKPLENTEYDPEPYSGICMLGVGQLARYLFGSWHKIVISPGI